MKKQEISAVGIVGISVELGLLEVQALKSKWEQFSALVVLLTEEDERIDKDMNVFMSKLLGDIPSDNDIHEALFGDGMTEEPKIATIMADQVNLDGVALANHMDAEMSKVETVAEIAADKYYHPNQVKE